MSDAQAGVRDDSELRTILIVIYALFVLAIFNGFSAIVGVIIAYLKRDAARGTLWEGHFRNLVQVFWITLGVAVIALILLIEAAGGFIFTMATTDGHPPPLVIGWLIALVPVFWLGAVVFSIWYLYRTLRGLVLTLDSKPY
jgi:uncharacterized membrane protein